MQMYLVFIMIQDKCSSISYSFMTWKFEVIKHEQLLDIFHL